jgi:hypothetical protein
MLGVWINASNPVDTLIISDTMITRWYILAHSYGHYYRYRIKNDSILIKYTGINKLGLPAYKRKIFINKRKDSLRIQDFHSVHPSYPGDLFLKPINK